MFAYDRVNSKLILLFVLCVSLLSSFKSHAFIGDYLAADSAIRQFNFIKATGYYDEILSNESVYLNNNQKNLAIQASETYLKAGQYDKVIKLNETYGHHAIPRIILALKSIRQQRWQRAWQHVNAIEDNSYNKKWRNLTLPLIRTWLYGAQHKTDKALDELEKLNDSSALRELLLVQKIPLYLHLGQPQKVINLLGYYNITYTDLNQRLLPYYIHALALTQGSKAAINTLDSITIGEQNSYLKKLHKSLYNQQDISKISLPIADNLNMALHHISDVLKSSHPHHAILYSRLAHYANPLDSAPLFTLADIFAEQGLYQDAINLIESVSSSAYYSSYEALLSELLISSYLLQKGQAEQAEKLLVDLLQDYPDNELVKNELGYLYRFTEQSAKSIDYYNSQIASGVDLGVDGWQFYYYRAIAYDRLGDWDMAESDLLEALSLSSENPFIMNYLGYSWADRGENLERCLDLLTRAVELRSDDGAMLDSLGWVYYRLGDYARAADLLERAIMFAPDSAVIIDHLGDAYWRGGRKTEARFQWRRVIESDDASGDLILSVGIKLDNSLLGSVSL